MKNRVFYTAPHRRLSWGSTQRGLTLVELMVAIVLNLLLVLAAASIYLNTRATQRAVDQRSALLESGQQVLELVGRDVANAGFYPTVSVEPDKAGGAPRSNVLMSFDGAAGDEGLSLPDAFRYGIFGCSNGDFNVGNASCVTTGNGVVTTSDALVISYFTNDTFSLDVGNRADCTRSDAANDATHNPMSRVGSISVDKQVKDANGNTSTVKTPVARTSNDNLVPLAPLFVFNRYVVRPSDSNQPNGPRSLWCSGNGNNGGQASVELIPNVEQFTVRYGVLGASGQSPVTYMSASDLAASGDKNFNGVAYTPWERVVAVRICVMVRSDPQTRLDSGSATAVTDCAGNSVNQPAGVSFRTFSQVFGLKNRQNGTI